MHKPRNIDEALSLAEEHEYLRTNEAKIRVIDSHSDMNDIVNLIQKQTLATPPNPPQPHNNVNTVQANDTSRLTRCFRCNGNGHLANTCSSP